MNNLTTTEVKVLNQLSTIRNRAVALGTMVYNLVMSLKTVGTPVNAVNATATLEVSGVVVHGETVRVTNPLFPEDIDRYEFVAREDWVVSEPTNYAVNITEHTTAAIVTLTVDVQPSSGDKMVLGAKEYTFVPVGTDTADGEISVGATLAEAQANIVAAINGTDAFNTPNSLVKTFAFGGFSDDDVLITALIGGDAGNSIASTETFTAATNVFSSVTLEGGVDCSAANAVAALVLVMTNYNSQRFVAENGDGDTILITALDGGVVGNDILVETTMENGSFTADATHLSGGVNGTVGNIHKFMVDSDYLYVCVDDNTTGGKNWRRISLGSPF